MDLTPVLLLGGVVVGAVEFVKALFDKEYRTSAIIAVSALVGGLVAHFAPEFSLSIVMGIYYGIAASGVVTVAKRLGGN